MFYVYFTRQNNVQSVAQCRTRFGAIARADEELAAGGESIAVLDPTGMMIYEPEDNCEEMLVDEW